jgi:hypothetical protein
MFQGGFGTGGLPGLEIGLRTDGGRESSASSPVRRSRPCADPDEDDAFGFGGGHVQSPQRSPAHRSPRRRSPRRSVPKEEPADAPADRRPAGIPVLRKSTVPDSFHTARTDAVGGSNVWNDAYHTMQGKDVPSGKPNITKMDRKQAWIRFLALEACMQVCVESVLSSTASATDLEFTRTLLADGSRVLKAGLGLQGLLLDGDGHGASVNIHWDDAAEGAKGRIVMVDDGRRDTFSVEKARPIVTKPPALPAPAAAHAGQALELQHFGVPAVEVKVSRVVGAPFLDTVCHDASVDEGPGEYTIRAFVKGGAPCTSAIGSTGGVVSGKSLFITGSQVTSVKDVLYLEVYRHDEVLEACASVMISELQRLAVRSDALGQEPPPSLLKQLMHPSGFGRKRKDSGGSMVWAKLVATDGAPAGHVLLAAKARVDGLIIGGGGIGGVGTIHGGETPGASVSGSGSATGSGPGVHASAPLIPSSVHDAGAMTPIQIRAHHGDLYQHQYQTPHHGLTVHRQAKTQLVMGHGQGGHDDADADDDLVNFAGPLEAEDPVGVSVLAKKKHAYGNVTGGYLQVNARHVYDVLLDCALKSSGCDRNGSSLELHPQWSWLTKQFAQKHGIREEYATLAYLQWILENHCVQPNSMCFEVIAAKHVAMKTASKASSLESHEVAMNTVVRQDIKSLLNKTFENYFALKQNYDDDVEFLPTRGPQAATVLRSAIKLLFLVLDGDAQSCGHWMAVRFKRAANKRFYAILAAIEAQIIEREGANKLKNKNRLAAAGKGTSIASVSSADVIAYKKVGDLCRSVVEEVREDEAIQASLAQSSAAHEGASAASICEQTSMEYTKGIAAHLKAVLSRYPPRKPSPAAIALVQAVGSLQDFLERHQYMDAAVRLNSFEAFSGFIQHWISSSSASLRRGVQIIDESPGSGPDGVTWKDLHENKGNMVVPFADVLLRELQKEMEVYRPILGIWPSYASDVERACVDVLRLAITVASRHCGLVQTSKESTVAAAGGSSSSRRRTAWKWASTVDAQGAPLSNPVHKRQESVTDAIRYGTNVHQALLMNTLRRLLAVMPQIESTIQMWSEDRPETSVSEGGDDGATGSGFGFGFGFELGETGVDGGIGGIGGGHGGDHRSLRDVKSPAKSAARRRNDPNLGALWAQLVKEVRTEYYATITLTAEALSRQLASSQATSVQHALRKSGLEASESSMVRKSERALDQTSPTLHILSSVLDSRVFVALTRGLWDLTARHILQYAEDLTEGAGGTHGAWRGRQNASIVLACVGNFYKHEISACMGSDLQAKDLDAPQHFQRASALLSKGSNRVDQSFDVY